MTGSGPSWADLICHPPPAADVLRHYVAEVQRSLDEATVYLRTPGCEAFYVRGLEKMAADFAVAFLLRALIHYVPSGADDIAAELITLLDCGELDPLPQWLAAAGLDPEVLRAEGVATAHRHIDRYLAKNAPVMDRPRPAGAAAGGPGHGRGAQGPRGPA